MTTDRRLRALADSLLDLDYETWNFGDSVAFEAMLAASDSLGDERWAAFAYGWVRSWATRAEPYRRLDCTAPGHAIVRLAERYRDGRLVEAAARLADYLLARPRLDKVFLTWEHSPLMHPYGPAKLGPAEVATLSDPPPGVFLDCLHFDPPFLTALGKLTRDQRYWRTGLDQAAGYVRLLQTASGLFDHFVLLDRPGRFGPGWGRGQGWALLGLLDVVELATGLPLNKDDEQVVGALRDAARRLIREMLTLQRHDGHWYAVVDLAESGDEFSTAAFMASALPRAADLGIVSRENIADPANRALVATRNGLDNNATLREVSAAVMACTEASHYAHVPRGFRVAWGQGPAMLALTAAIVTP